MPMQWKSAQFHFLFFFLIGGFLPAGCRPTPASDGVSPASHQGIELRIACPNEATADLLQNFGRTWALRQGAKIHVQRYEPTAGPQAAGPADIWIIEPAELPRWADAGRLAPVPEHFTARDSAYAWADLLPTYRDRIALWEKIPYGWLLIGESPLCCYRKDWLDDPAHQKAFLQQSGHALAPPATWEQFVHIAEYFHKKEPKEPTPSLPPLPRGDVDLDRLFYTIAAGYVLRAVPSEERTGADRQNDLFSFHYDRQTGQPRLATPGFVHSLQLLQRLQVCRPAAPADRPEQAFREGRAVLCLTDAPWLKLFQRTAALRDKVGVCRVPGAERYYDFRQGRPHSTPDSNRVPYLGGAGWLGVVPRDSAHPAAAFDLLAELSGPKTSLQIFLGEDEHGGLIRGEQLNRERWESFDLDERQTNNLREALRQTLLHYGLKNPAVCLRTPRQATHRAALVRQLRAALLEGTDAEVALRKAAESWEQLDREQGLEAHKADYRRSLGLLAE
jgi:multiple sugar transport system substrate-binding protein